jgi:hypothetical protein
MLCNIAAVDNRYCLSIQSMSEESPSVGFAAGIDATVQVK